MLALGLVETGVEQVACEEGQVVEVASGQVNSVVAAGPQVVATARLAVVVVTSSEVLCR